MTDRFTQVPVDQIDPSPYQPRRRMDEEALQQLAADMQANGLLEPIVCRPVHGRYELICGERRWRAAQLNGWDTIPAIVRDLNDLQAQMACLAENLQRVDLTVIEEIEGICLWVDAYMRQDPEWLPWLEATYRSRQGGPRLRIDFTSPVDRTTYFLALCDSDYRNGTARVTNKFVRNLEKAFASLNRPVDWLSYFKHDLPFLRDTPPFIREAAIEQKLNKSQTEALRELHEKAPEVAEKVIRDGAVEVLDGDRGLVRMDLRDVSAREIRSLATQPEDRRPSVAQLIVQSNSNEWYTPKEYIDAARAVLGGIDVDPASCEAANRVVGAPVYYTAQTDGLAHDWPGRVWLNPPWGDLTAKFVAKLLAQYRAGITKAAILLVNAHSTDTDWFQPLWDYVLCFTDHRINFTSPTGTANGSTHGSAFVYLGPEPARFARTFSRYGAVVRRWTP